MDSVFFTPFPIPYSFDGYVINIGNTGINIINIDESTLELQNAIPNPSNQMTNIKFSSNKSENLSFQITNLLGETIYSDNVISKRGVNDIIVNTSSFSEGIYVYSISNNITKSSKRLVVNH